MADFTSALYLGMRHPSATLPSWDSFSAGQPAALQEPAGSADVATRLAKLQGCEAAVMLPSTLHLFWDLFGMLRNIGGKVAVLVDAGTYPIARWGTERAAARGVPVERFIHHDLADVARRVRAWRQRGNRPVIVCDGFCPSCGNPAPLAAYAELARQNDGWLVVDDTQALGILGASPDVQQPLGSGGGGSLRWHGVQGPHIVVGASLAKAFGAPVAALSASAELVARFSEHSDTRMHCSPPSVAVLRAATLALSINAARGDALRWRLVRLLVRLRERMVAAGLSPGRSALPFPVQSFTILSGMTTQALYRGLLARGIRVLLTSVCRSARPRITMLVTARHGECDIEQAARAIAALMHTGRMAAGTGGEAIWNRQ